MGAVGQRQDRAQALLETTITAIADNATKQEKGIKRFGADIDLRYAKMTYEEFGALLGVIASQNKESFPSYEAYTQYLRDSTSMSITLTHNKLIL